MNALINDRLSRLLTDLDNLPYMGRRDRIVTEVLETDGLYTLNGAEIANPAFLCELWLHGILAIGEDEADVITNCIDAANAQRDAVAA